MNAKVLQTKKRLVLTRNLRNGYKEDKLAHTVEQIFFKARYSIPGPIGVGYQGFAFLAIQ
jgi:hypothetical protein